MERSLKLFAQGLAAALRFVPVAWRTSWAALCLTAVAVGLALGQAIAWWAPAVLLALVARGGLWRAAMRRGRNGPGGLQAGMVELRLAAVWLLSAIFLAILALLMLVVFLCCAYAAASAGQGFNTGDVGTWRPAIQGRGDWLLAVVGFIGVVAMALAATRISLAEPATVAREKVQVLSAWPLTRGRALSLLAANLILAAPCLALFVLHASSLPWIVVRSLVAVGLWLPASVGFIAYAYESCTQDK